jgi:hypothetical protein
MSGVVFVIFFPKTASRRAKYSYVSGNSLSVSCKMYSMAVFLRAQALKVPVVFKSARLHAIYELRGGGRGAKSVCVI